MKVKCSGCSKSFKAKESLAGKRVKCPSCGAAIQIPDNEPDVELVDIAPDSGWQKTNNDDNVVADIDLGPLTATCSSCGAAMPQNAVLCVQCGFGKSGKFITEINTDAELHLSVIRQLGISFSKLSLNLDGTVYSIHDTCEICKDVVTW